MSVQIKVDAEAVDLLYKYCKKSPAEIPPVLTRLLREWVKKTAYKWYQDPSLIPKMPDIPESRMTSVGINHEWGKTFKNTIKKMNLKEGIDIVEEKLASILLVAYIKTYKVEEKGKWYRSKNWGSPG